MTAREMHYDLKQKLNKLDSQKYRNLVVPEIDWKLNEAQEVFVKMIAEPRLRSQLGFEMNERTIDDIRTIVVNQKPIDYLTANIYDDLSFIVDFPDDYWFYANSKVIATKGSCEDKRLATRQIQHDDEAEISPFDKSSFEWRVSNIRFISDGIRVFTDGTYTINKMALSYLIQPTMIHNAQDFQTGTYNMMDGTPLTGSQNCMLPKPVHREIVDLAVLIIAGDLSLPDYMLKQNKLKLTN